MKTTLIPSQLQATVQSTSSAAGTYRSLVGAALLGIVVLFAVGFMPMDIAHNAAHDSRHSHIFPCH